MILDAGILRLYRPVTTSAVTAGNMPENSSESYYRAWYGLRTVGYKRYYEAQGVNNQIDLLVRIIRPESSVTISTGDTALLSDGKRYRILQAQYLRDDDAGEDVVDLSLERIGNK